MCGILCCLGYPVSELQTKRHEMLKLARKIRHRGPDWSGSRTDCVGSKANTLCHERLGIVDPAGGEQPLLAEKAGRTISCSVNGEIYNYRDIIQGELKGSPFRTGSDCEVIPWLWDGSAAGQWISKLDGMFCFVCSDSQTGHWIAGRDHLGLESLYIAWEGEAVWVASEMKAFPHSVEKIEEFPPGHWYSSHDRTFHRWYQPAWLDRALIPSSPLDLAQLRTGFESAVTKMLMGDVPYGLLLSGGLDSSLVAACAARHARTRLQDGIERPAWFPRLHSFCIGLPGSPDLKAAESVAKFLDLEHHSFTFTMQQGLDALSDVIYHLETYDVTTVRASTPMYLLCRKVKAMGIKMVLSGEGSDEAFGGYLYFHHAPSKEAFHRETVDKLSLLSKYDNLRANKATMAWGVEARVPFLDPQFLDMVMSLDPAVKMVTAERPIEKHILRAAFDVEPAYLPKEVLWRQKEQFSDGVGYAWIDGLRDYASRQVTDQQFAEAATRFPYNTPNTKEAYHYRALFEAHYPRRDQAQCTQGGFTIACSTPAALEWQAAWRGLSEPSGRAVAVHSSKQEKKGGAD